MEHRGGVQIDRAARPQALAKRVHRVDHQIAVAEHHALGTAGGAAGIEDAGKIGAIAHRIRHRLAAFDQRLVPFHSRRRFAFVGVDQLQARNSLRQRRADGGKRLVDEQDVGAAIAHGVFVLERAPADVERHDDGAGPAGGQIKLEIAVGVERQHRDAVADAGAERTNSCGKPRHAFADIAPVSPPLAAHDGEPVRIDLQRAPQPVRDVHFVPPGDFLCFAGGFSVFFFGDLAAMPSVRRVANSRAIASADKGPPG